MSLTTPRRIENKVSLNPRSTLLLFLEILQKFFAVSIVTIIMQSKIFRMAWKTHNCPPLSYSTLTSLLSSPNPLSNFPPDHFARRLYLEWLSTLIPTYLFLKIWLSLFPQEAFSGALVPYSRKVKCTLYFAIIVRWAHLLPDTTLEWYYLFTCLTTPFDGHLLITRLCSTIASLRYGIVP